MEEYMESELSDSFRVKLVTKNIVRGSPGTQFMHMMVKAFHESESATDCTELYTAPFLNKKLLL